MIDVAGIEHDGLGRRRRLRLAVQIANVWYRCDLCSLCVEARSSPTSIVVCLGNGILGGPGKEVSIYRGEPCVLC